MRGQITVEFSMMVMLAFTFLVIALVIVAFYLERTSREQGIALLQDEAARLQQELLLAAGVEDGYQRSIVVPERLDDRPYTLSNTPTVLTLELSDGTTYNKEIPLASGSFAKGPNRIRRSGNIIIIDQP